MSAWRRWLQVRDGASEELRRARGKVATIAGRVRGILKNHGGEVTEQVLRAALAP